MKRNRPIVFFRVDASLEIGAGHVIRCITLAKKIRKQGAECHFIFRELLGNMEKVISENGFQCHILPVLLVNYISNNQTEYEKWLGCSWETDVAQVSEIIKTYDIDWLVVDHYALDKRWQVALKEHYQKLLVIDDLADRQHNCDLLIDPNLGRDSADYNDLVPKHCTCLCGSEYALLRSDFGRLRKLSLEHKKKATLNHILITMGGIDIDNITEKVLNAISHTNLPNKCKITVVLGWSSPWIKKIKQQALKMPWTIDVKVGVDNMAQLMADSDLAISAAGSTSWELCCLGLPSLLIVTADNQTQIASILKNESAALVIGNNNSVTEEEIHNGMQELIFNNNLRVEMSRKAERLCDGRGAERIYLATITPFYTKEGKSISFGLVEIEDTELIYTWQSHQDTRRYAVDKSKITIEQHEKWMNKTIFDSKKIFLMIMFDEIPAGTIRLDNTDVENVMNISIYISPDKYRLGIAETAMFLLIETFKGIRFGARVLSENISSNELFKKIGFIKVKNNYYMSSPELIN